MNQWYVLFTKANSERQVAAALTERSLETFLPQIRIYRTGVGTPQFRTETLFPCYLFLCADLDHLSPSEWQWTPGLRWMVHSAGEPAAVPDQAIDAIRKEVARRNESSAKDAGPFQHGDIVRITRGPMADLLAVFDSRLDGNGRSQVLVDFLGRICRAQVGLQDLEKVTSDTAERFRHRSRSTRGRGRRIVSDRTDRRRPHSL